MLSPQLAHRQALVKCVVWDLDETLWDGVLLEGGGKSLKPGIVEIVRELDARGILQSVASKNDYDIAWPVIESFGLSEYLLFPHISWNSKAESIRSIASCLGIGVDALAFVDDQVVERDEVRYFLPQVRVIDSADISDLLEQEFLRPRSITDEARSRRLIYRAEMERTEAGQRFSGTRDEFLATLGMQMTIHPIGRGDLARAEELTIRTNQLNTTGLTYSREELEGLSRSPAHLVLAVKLADRYGSSGTVGLAVVEKSADLWTILLLIMSCRVATCGVGTALIGHLVHSAAASGVRLRAAFAPTDRNRQMYIAYKFAGFRDSGTVSGMKFLDHDFQRMPVVPSYITVIADVADVARPARSLADASP
ncbi:HAD-IIIC family phosphatase [Marilutibacter chinensis]|uniref:HAD-IIIC family phosphatase n=1 Tax=Marilutibacter chinensis TaxID=2912247 RepID=A0ABS9HY17_9GAMM|nr:HAD-IIIC family phosphatase [Lysobacter chinensis]MCF7223761.1 HAD-IIIC family phosphatase [Lysobacter chinensis]